MAISTIEIPKKLVGNLRETPRDIFFSLEAVDPGASPLFVRINYAILGGIGLDLDISNAAAALGPAIITIDKTKVITLPAGTRFTLESVLFSLIEIQRDPVIDLATTVNVYHAGLSYDAIKEMK